MARHSARGGGHSAGGAHRRRDVTAPIIVISLFCAAIICVSLGFWFSRSSANRGSQNGAGPPGGYSAAHVEYSTTETTRGPVVATLVLDDGGSYTVLGDGQTTHTFTKNGIHVFKLKDKEDNITQIRAGVTWIVHSAGGGE